MSTTDRTGSEEKKAEGDGVYKCTEKSRKEGTRCEVSVVSSQDMYCDIVFATKYANSRDCRHKRECC
jgi:hypothetical protein